MDLPIGSRNNDKNVTGIRSRFIDIFAIYSYGFIYFCYCIGKRRTNITKDFSKKRFSLNHPAFTGNRKEIKTYNETIRKAVFREKYMTFKNLYFFY